jgi:hypothetical protein
MQVHPIISKHLLRRSAPTTARLHNTRAVHKARPKNAIRILKHAVLQTDYNKLTPFEPRFEQAADILGMAEIEGGVDLVEDVHRGWFELQESHYEREGD